MVLGTKLAIRSYRKIKAKSFFSESLAAGPKAFYKGTFLNPMTRREA
jgi:hypothetical protein